MAELQWWFLIDGKWAPREAGKHSPAGSWYEGDVPEGWLFWSEKTRRGLWQRWERDEVGAVYLGGISVEPNTLALDLATARANVEIPSGGSRQIKHRFRWIKNMKIVLQ